MVLEDKGGIMKTKGDVKAAKASKGFSQFLFKPSVWSLSLLVFCVFLNIAGYSLFARRSLPLWMDSVGTLIAAIELGPLGGVLAGMIASIIISFFVPTNLPYTLVAIGVGFSIGVFYPRKKQKDAFAAISSAVLAGIVALVISVPLNMLFADGYTGNEWGDALIDMLSKYFTSMPLRAILGQAFVDIPDKIYSLILAVLLIRVGERIWPMQRRKKNKLGNRPALGVLASFFFLSFGTVFLQPVLPGLTARAAALDELAAQVEDAAVTEEASEKAETVPAVNKETAITAEASEKAATLAASDEETAITAEASEKAATLAASDEDATITAEASEKAATLAASNEDTTITAEASEKTATLAAADENAAIKGDGEASGRKADKASEKEVSEASDKTSAAVSEIEVSEASEEKADDASEKPADAAAASAFGKLPSNLLSHSEVNFASDYETVRYGTDDGLVSAEVNAIAQTPDGYIWAGTYSGLYRYNGTRFQAMQMDSRFSSITVLHVDARGRLWIGTNDSGLCCYNPETSEFYYYNVYNGLGSNAIRSITEDRDGNLYVGTVTILSKIGKDGDVTTFTDWDYISGVRSITLAEDGTIAGVCNSGALFFIRDDELVGYYMLDDHGVYYAAVAADGDGNYLVGTSADYALKVRLGKQGIDVLQRIDMGETAAFNKILYDPEADGYFYCCANGLGFISNKDGKVTDLSSSSYNSSIGDVFLDYQRNIWFASDKQGIQCLSWNPFEDIFIKCGLQPNVVNSLLIDEGLLYIATDGGLDIVDLDSFEEVKPDWISVFDGVRIRHILRDSAGNFWFSTFGPDGLVEISPEGDVHSYTEKTEGTLGGRFRFAMELRDGRILASSNMGLNYIRDGKVEKTLGDDEGITAQILSLVEESNGDLRAGSDGDGAFIIRGDRIVRRIGKREGMNSQVIMKIVPCSRGYIYVTSNALYYDNGHSVKCLDAFPYSNNYDVYITDEGVAWVSSSAGLFIVKEEDLIANKGSSEGSEESESGNGKEAASNGASGNGKDTAFNGASGNGKDAGSNSPKDGAGSGSLENGDQHPASNTESGSLRVVENNNQNSMGGYSYDLLNKSRGFNTTLTSNATNAVDGDELYLCCTTGVKRISVKKYNAYDMDYQIRLSSLRVEGQEIHPVDGQYDIPPMSGRIEFDIAVLNFNLSNPLLRIYLENSGDTGVTCHQDELVTFSFTNLPHGDYALHVQVLDATSNAVLREEVFPVHKAAMLYEQRYFRLYLLFVVTMFMLFLGWLVGHIHQKDLRIQGLQKEASTDLMTGLLNKAASQKAIGEAMAEGEGIFTIIDLDSFKLVNDLYGHDMGDKILIRFSELIVSHIRWEDLAGRIGGDEFVAYFRDTNSENAISRITALINEEIMQSAKEYMGEDMNIPLGCSIGAVKIPEGGRDYHEIYKKADRALYQVKMNGKHGYAFYNAAGMESEQEDSAAGTMESIRMVLGERNIGKGAFRIDFDKFKVAYRMVMRLKKEHEADEAANGSGATLSRIKPHILSISLHDEAGGTDVPAEVAEDFQEFLAGSLRPCDIIAANGSSRFVVLRTGLEPEDVPEAGEENAEAWQDVLAAWRNGGFRAAYEEELI